jgi:hypothetical protein
MGHPFEMWADRIEAASTDEARRALVTEARVLRARSLADPVALRRATYTLSQLHHLLQERDPAAHEARQLLSLCQTPPVASREEIEATQAWLRALGERAPKVVAPPKERSWRDDERRARPDRPDRPGRREPAAPAARAAAPPAADLPSKVRGLALDGRWSDALAAAADGRGPGAELTRAAIRLHLALESAEPLAAVRALRDELHQRTGLARKEVPADPLAAILGDRIPTRRAERIDAIEAFAKENPERLDELAAASLRQHLVTAGAGAAAPWLAGVVARAQASGASPQTDAAMAELRAAGSVAVLCYDEWPYTRLQRVFSKANADGVPVSAVRRGVLARHEPDDRKLWTLRVAPADGERMLAVAPHATTPYEGDLARELAERLRSLCGATLLLATGSGNEALRAHARELGLAVRDRDADDSQVLAELLAVAPVAPSPAAPGPSARAAARAERTGAPSEHTGSPSERTGSPAAPVDRLADLVTVAPLDRPRIQAAIASMRRADRALRIVQKLPLTDEALSLVLEVVASTIGNDRPIPEGTTLALRAAVTGPLTRATLRDPRYGGPGIDTLVDIAGTLHAAGWEVHRVLRGATRRETERQPALDSLSAGLGGFWRLLVRRGDRKGEVWFVAELPIEGRAAVPLLLLEDFQRTIVAAGEAEFWAGLGQNALQWELGAEPALVAAVEQFVVREEPHDAGDDAAGTGATA